MGDLDNLRKIFGIYYFENHEVIDAALDKKSNRRTCQ